MDPYLAKKGDFPRISDGFSDISVESKGLNDANDYDTGTCDILVEDDRS